MQKNLGFQMIFFVNKVITTALYTSTNFVFDKIIILLVVFTPSICSKLYMWKRSLYLLNKLSDVIYIENHYSRIPLLSMKIYQAKTGLGSHKVPSIVKFKARCCISWGGGGQGV